MRQVNFESTAFGDVLVDENGDPLNIIFETGGGSEPIPVVWKESVEAVADLPATDNVLGDARLVRSVRRIYTWTGVDGWLPLADSVGSGGGGGLSFVDTEADLPAEGVEGEVYLVVEGMRLKGWNPLLPPVIAYYQGATYPVPLGNYLGDVQSTVHVDPAVMYPGPFGGSDVSGAIFAFEVTEAGSVEIWLPGYVGDGPEDFGIALFTLEYTEYPDYPLPDGQPSKYATSFANASTGGSGNAPILREHLGLGVYVGILFAEFGDIPIEPMDVPIEVHGWAGVGTPATTAKPASDVTGEWLEVGQLREPVATAVVLPLSNNRVGDLRLAIDDRSLHIWTGTEWELVRAASELQVTGLTGAIDKLTFGNGVEVTQSGSTAVVSVLGATVDLGEELPWYETDGDTAGSFLIRAQRAIENADMQTDPELVTEGYSGLVYYPPDLDGPGGYEPSRSQSDWNLQRVRKESRNVLFRKAWDVDAWGTVASDYVFNGLHSLAVTVGRPSSEGYSTLYGEIDRTSGLLRFGRVSGSDQSISYAGLESVEFPSPPAGSQFYIWMYRQGDIITLYADVNTIDGAYYSAEIMHVVDSDTDSWMQPFAGLYPGFGSQWGDVNYGHRFDGASFIAQDAWRELVLKLKSAEANVPEIDLILADTRTGWLVGGGSGTPFVLSVNGSSPVDELHIDGSKVTQVYDAANDRMMINVGDPSMEDLGLNPDFDWDSVPEKLARRPFIPIDTNDAGGITQPALENNPDIAGPRYLCSYMHDATGFTVFRGFFIAAAAGSGLIGVLEEDYRPPHTVRMCGVREDGTTFTVRVEPNGEMHSYGHQAGRNHLDGGSFYQGEGPIVIVGTFIPDPQNPYRMQNGGPSEYGPDKFNLIGAGLFEYPRTSDTGKLSFDLPYPGPGFDWYYLADGAYVTYTVISGPDAGQSGNATFTGGEYGNSIVVTLPLGLDGEVRVTLNNFTYIPAIIY